MSDQPEQILMENPSPSQIAFSPNASLLSQHADACEPKPLAKQNDAVAHTSDNPRRYSFQRFRKAMPCRVRVHHVIRMWRIVPAIVSSKSWWILKEMFEEKCFYWHNTRHSAWPRRWRADNFENKESLTQMCLCVITCGVSTQQWPSTQITLFARTRQSAWLYAVTTSVDEKQVNSCVLKHLFFWGSSATKEFAKKTQKCSFQCGTNVRFSKNCGWRRIKKRRCTWFF